MLRTTFIFIQLILTTVAYGQSSGPIKMNAILQEGQGNGLIVSSIDSNSALLIARFSDGTYGRLDVGDKIVKAADTDTNSLKSYFESANKSVKTNGFINITGIDVNTGNQFEGSLVLLRNDISESKIGSIRSVVKSRADEIEKHIRLKVVLTKDRILLGNYRKMYLPPCADPLEEVLNTYVSLELFRRAVNNKEKLGDFFSAYTMRRCERILLNCSQEIAVNKIQDMTLALLATSQVKTEIDNLLDHIARITNRKMLEEQVEIMKITFAPRTNYANCSVEVILVADVKLKRIMNNATVDEIDSLSGWTALPQNDAKAYGRYYYRLRDTSSGRLITNFNEQKVKPIVSQPNPSTILFE